MISAGTSPSWAGETDPHGMQHLLCRASWDADETYTADATEFGIGISSQMMYNGHPYSPESRPPGSAAGC
ncbi:hypothetical protein [Streptomyces sp. NPDC086777]|uniref:hypothetical protein n=1 Tax=Streptomyces sp. NPDC086777 TaxID=3154866 RepID=UPI00344F068A